MRRWYALSLSVMLLGGLLRIWVQQEIVQLGYSLSAEQAKQAELRAALQQIEVELATAHAPITLQLLAKRYGLAPARPEQIVKLPGLRHHWSEPEELVDAEP